jgi:sodium-dependent dicarboxylate transporter 2/3/5
MASLIGTPPNAIGVGAMAEISNGPKISFLGWLIIGLPPALLLLAVAWALIRLMYKFESTAFSLPQVEAQEPSVPRWQIYTVTITLLITVGLWLTSGLHRAPTAAISFIPIVMFTTTGILSVERMRGLPFDVLFLLAGGLALGHTVTTTGLSLWIADLLPTGDLPPLLIALMFAYLAVAMSNFMSNTAAATVLIPISITVAAGFEGTAAVSVALGASAAMLLPVATPPNAMAFATGHCETRDFIRIGVVLGLITPPIAVLWIATIVAFV